MTDTERIERLEKIVEKLYHESELLSLYIPKLCDILIKYWKESPKYRKEIEVQLRGIKDYAILLDNDVQKHFSQPHPYKKKYKY